MKKKTLQIILIVIFACVVMGYIDAVLQPGYIIKSTVKLLLFLICPIFYCLVNREKKLTALFVADKKGLALAVGAGLVVYAVVLGAYFLFRDVFDFSGLTKSLTATTGVNQANFLWVALYISFINSLLEEFFFRGFGYLVLQRESSQRFACLFSSLAFSLYHVAMMIGWFGLPVVFLSLLGLFAGGIIFNKLDEKSETIYLSWLVHMFANFATNTIGFILFAMQVA